MGDSGFDHRPLPRQGSTNSLQNISRACEIPANRRILRRDFNISGYPPGLLRGRCTIAALFLLVGRPSLNELALFYRGTTALAKPYSRATNSNSRY